MKKSLVLFSIVFLIINVYAQKPYSGGIRGKVLDTTSKQTLANASLSILRAQDSSAVMNGQVQKGGKFELRGLKEGSYRLTVSFLGYRTLIKTFNLSKEKSLVDFGDIVLERESEMLQEVVVQIPPVTIKNDTIEFNAGSFVTKPNAVVEDLIKKLPGMQVDKSGTITAQGEKVTRVLVDGKRFFGDDPKLATKNLPPDIVDKIQVFDDLSDQSKFTGFDDGNRVKTINIVTKKDKRKGYFGKAVAGIGTEGNYDNSVNIHRFEGDQQISVLGQANDINKQNFTAQDFGATGGGKGGGGRGGGGGGGGANTGNGINTTWAGGLNFRDQFGKKTQLYSSYFYNNHQISTDQQSAQQNLLSRDSSTFSNLAQFSLKKNDNHRINFNVEHQLDSNNSLIFRPNISLQSASNSSSRTNIYTGGKSATPIYTTESNSAQDNSGQNGQYSLLLRHKFKKRFRTISLDLSFSGNSNNGDGTILSVNTYPAYIDTINQHIISASKGTSFGPTLSFTEPMGKNKILEFNYHYSFNKNSSDRYIYNFDGPKGYDIFDSTYSNAFENTYSSNRFSVNYRIQNARYNFNIGTGIQSGKVNSVNYTKNYDISQQYVNLTPTVNFQYNFSKTQNLKINYSGRTSQPGVTQLQPIVVTTDSINFSQGNPNLKQQFTQSVRILYTKFNTVTQRVIFATVNLSMIGNDIQNSINYLPTPPNKNGSTITTPVNLSGSYAANGYFNYGFPLKKPKSNLNFTTNVGYNQSQTLVNLASNYTRNTTLGETISWTTNLKENFDMNLSATTTYNIARNSLQPKQNLNYYTQVLSTELTYYTKSGWIVAADFDYIYNGNRATGYNASTPLLNPSIAKQVFRNKQGELRLSVFDLLNQNISVSRSVTANAIVDSRTNVLTRYAMLTLTYNLRKFAGQKQKMPGMLKNLRGMQKTMAPGMNRGGRKGSN